MLIFGEDQFYHDTYETHTKYRATLSNGLEFISDDGRNANDEFSWCRLSKYCKENNVFVINFVMQNRSHREQLRPDADGYYLSMGAGRWYANERTDAFFVAGYLVNDTVFKSWWKIPELEVTNSQEVTLSEVLESPLKECLILKSTNPTILTN